MRASHTLVYKNNADLGKGVPRQHVFHEAWELLFFRFLAKTANPALLIWFDPGYFNGQG
jgi:hypothetical protein